MRKIKGIYRKKGIQVCDKKNETKPLSSDYDPCLKSKYKPQKDNEIWISYRGQYGVNPLRTDVAKALYKNIKVISHIDAK